MRFYPFAKIAARCFPTMADLNNPWIFPKDVALVINVSKYFDPKIAKAIEDKHIVYLHFPLDEEVADIGWNNIKEAVKHLLRYDKEDKRMVVHCDFGQHRSRLVIEAFYYAKYGEHFIDKYKDFDNHLIYDCQTKHLPELEIVENELALLQ